MAISETHSTDRRMPVPSTSRFNALDWIALVLMIIGGLNWGLVALFEFDLVAALFGTMSAGSRVVYALVGVAALYGIALAVRHGRHKMPMA
jgi:uncharacterized membrane protein YuzA (DUF378 family)